MYQSSRYFSLKTLNSDVTWPKRW